MNYSFAKRGNDERTIDDVRTEIEDLIRTFEKISLSINNHFEKSIIVKDRVYDFIFMASRRDRNHKKDIKQVKDGTEMLEKICNLTIFENLQLRREQILQELSPLFDEYITIQNGKLPELDKYIPDQNKKSLRLELLKSDYEYMTQWKNRIEKANVNWNMIVMQTTEISVKFEENAASVMDWIKNKPTEGGKVAMEVLDKTENLLKIFVASLQVSTENLKSINQNMITKFDNLNKFETEKTNYSEKSVTKIVNQLNEIDRYWKVKSNLQASS